MKRPGTLARKTPIARGGRIAPVNPKRRAKEVPRIYGSPARAKFVAAMPCAACGIVGYSVNAHLLGNGGGSRKADADTIGPLCCDRIGVVGCHSLYDKFRWIFDARFPSFDPADVADRTDRAWRRHVGGRAA